VKSSVGEKISKPSSQPKNSQKSIKSFWKSKASNTKSNTTAIISEQVNGNDEDLPPVESTGSFHSDDHINPDLVVRNVEYDMGDENFKGEGRTITIEFDKFFFVVSYVPNSGDDLRRLDYRINEW